MKYLLPLAALAVVLVAADKPAEDKKNDKERILGTWIVTGLEAKGEAVKSGDEFDHFKDMKLTFKDDGTVTNSKHADDKATYKIDADNKPATLDIDVTGKKIAMRVLYRFKDDNTLQLCGSQNDKERPKEFGSKDDQMVITLTREKK